MRLTDIERLAAAELGTPLVVAHAETPPESLSAAERRQLATFRFEARRRDWLVGRNALKQVLRRQGRPDDSAAAYRPDARVSLTHADGHAFAVGAATAGIGIDFERPRRVHPRMASWFLDDDEQAMLPAKNDASYDRELVRLWTIKEAAFKSHPANKNLTLTDLRIEKRGRIQFSEKRGRIQFSEKRGRIQFFEINCERMHSPGKLDPTPFFSTPFCSMRVFTVETCGGFLSIAGVDA